MSVDQLRARRLNRGLTLDDVAQETGVAKSVLARVERGEAAPRSPKVKLAIASFYGYSVTELWPLDEAEAAAA